jgi:hypothetical protein
MSETPNTIHTSLNVRVGPVMLLGLHLMNNGFNGMLPTSANRACLLCLLALVYLTLNSIANNIEGRLSVSPRPHSEG